MRHCWLQTCCTVFLHSKCGTVFVLWRSLTALADVVLVAVETTFAQCAAVSKAACRWFDSGSGHHFNHYNQQLNQNTVLQNVLHSHRTVCSRVCGLKHCVENSVCNSVFATQLGNTVNSSTGVWRVFIDVFCGTAGCKLAAQFFYTANKRQFLCFGAASQCLRMVCWLLWWRYLRRHRPFA